MTLPDSIWVWASVESDWSERRGLVSYQVRENSILLSRNTSRWCMGHCWNLCQPISSKLPFEWLEFLNESLRVHPKKPRRQSECHYFVYRRLLTTFLFSEASFYMDVCLSVCLSVGRHWHLSNLSDRLSWNIAQMLMLLWEWIQLVLLILCLNL